MAGAKCSLDKSQSAELIELRKGQTITIEGTIKDIYYFILISHILLSICVIPFVLITYVRAITNNIVMHKKIAKITFPLWLYVAVTGVIVYLMISPYY